MFLTAVIPLRVQRLLSAHKALGSILGQKETEEGRGRGREKRGEEKRKGGGGQQSKDIYQLCPDSRSYTGGNCLNNRTAPVSLPV